jgi:hypothetical protein
MESSNKYINGKVLLGELSPDWGKTLDPKHHYCIKTVSAKDILFRSGRFDLLSKYLYIKGYHEKLNLRWYEELYLSFIYHFNNFQESDGVQLKTGKSEFLESFSSLYHDILDNGYDEHRGLIPVTKTMVPIDGGHRIAICALLEIEVKVIILDEGTCFNYQYFSEKRLNQSISDFIAFTYCLYNKNAHIALLYPVGGVKRDEQTFKILNDRFDVFYVKEVELYGNGPFLLVQNAYRLHPWFSHTDQNENVKRKMKACFQGLAPLKVVVFHADSLDDVLSAKDAIRNLHQLENDSIHITDNSEETLECAKMLLNENSIHWLNNAQKFTPVRYEKLFQKLVSEVDSEKLESLCIEGSSVLATYGIRDVSDIDLWGNEENLLLLNNSEIEWSNENLAYLKECSLNDILNDPRNHFYYKDVKVLSLHILHKLKKARRSDKDKQDIVLIETMIVNQGHEKLLSQIDFLYTYYLGQLKLKLKAFLPKFVLGIYRSLRSFIQK